MSTTGEFWKDGFGLHDSGNWSVRFRERGYRPGECSRKIVRKSSSLPVSALNVSAVCEIIIMPLTIERTPNYLLVRGDGLGSLSEAQQHFRDLSSLLVAERKTTKGVRLLIDLQAAEPHPPEVAEHIERVLPVLYQEGDRVAVVVRNTLIKVGTKPSHNPLYSDVFLSREAAKAYLSE